MTAMQEEAAAPPKKKASKKASPEKLQAAVDAGVDAAQAVLDEPMLKVVRPRAKPGTKEFDWADEYPGEECYVYTSSDGLTVGLTKLGPHRKPKPGLLRRLHREGGMSVMWYFIELASSPASLTVQEELEEEDYTAMLRGWADFAGIELSE